MNTLEKWILYLYPTECIECRSDDFASRVTGICKACHRKEKNAFPNLDPGRCKVCKNPCDDTGNCSYCSSRNVFIDRTWILRLKGDRERELMNFLKFRQERILSRFFSLGLYRILPEIRAHSPQAVVPIPSHPSSYRERPYLATEITVRRLSQKLKIPQIDCLEKVSAVRQSSLLRLERFLHARKAFRLKKKCLHNLPNRVLLIDDVFTTGATTNEIACLLKSAGVNQVFQLILLRPSEGIEL